MSSARYHVIDSVEEWLRIKYNTMESVTVQEPKLPRFEFNVKVANNGKYKEVYIPGCAIAGIKELKNVARLRGCDFIPKNILKFAFDYDESVHCFSATETPQRHLPKFLYREPSDQHVALTVATLLFDPEDIIELYPPDQVIYYYLAVLKAVNHPVINQALLMYRHEAKDSNLYRSSLIPETTNQVTKSKYYSLYVDLIHFLGLMAPPMKAGDTNAEILEKVKARNAQQMKILCDTIGISDYQTTTRGCGWQKIVNFFDATPLLSLLMAKTVLNPGKLDRYLTVIESQVLQQLKQLWEWKGLHDFYLCCIFAADADTEAHNITSIHRQCERVKKLYKKLEEAVGDSALVPFAGLLIEDPKFFRAYNADLFPELFYAAVSKSTHVKKGNPAWEQFVATRSVNLPRKEIDQKLNILLPHARLREMKSSTDVNVTAQLSFSDQKSLILEAMEEHHPNSRHDLNRDSCIGPILDEIIEAGEEERADVNFELVHS